MDVNRQNYISQQAINKLAELQNEDGGWSWFKGFTSSTFMTENVLEAMARLVTLNITSHPEQVKKMQIKALQFLDKTNTGIIQTREDSRIFSDIVPVHT